MTRLELFRDQDNSRAAAAGCRYPGAETAWMAGSEETVRRLEAGRGSCRCHRRFGGLERIVSRHLNCKLEPDDLNPAGFSQMDGGC